jgi:hypothetical protein
VIKHFFQVGISPRQGLKNVFTALYARGSYLKEISGGITLAAPREQVDCGERRETRNVDLTKMDGKCIKEAAPTAEAADVIFI